MERLSALDAEFLHLEDGIAHMHLAGACVFEGPIPEYGDVEQLLRSKLHLIPRYRQRVRSVPLELGRPVWVDDPHFDLGFHLRHAALPAPGGARACSTSSTASATFSGSLTAPRCFTAISGRPTCSRSVTG